MKIYTTKRELRAHLDDLRRAKQTIGLVPTMGALHAGHLELISAAKKACESTVCSIFVNPTQFNDPRDLRNYPRTAEADIEKLEQKNCDILFMPPFDEMYSEEDNWHINLGDLESSLEGKFRPGHFQGVTQIVYKLFKIIEPDFAFFGQKDLQQFRVISTMTDQKGLPVKLIMCPIVREAGGLAMSSRNVRLSADDRMRALALVESLRQSVAGFKKRSLAYLREEAVSFLKNAEGIDLDYFEICDPLTLKPATDDLESPVALVAAKVGQVRLIDNMFLNAEV